MYSNEHKLYLRKVKRNNFFVKFFRIFILVIFVFLWEFGARNKIINPFLTSYPSEVVRTIISLFKDNNLLYHIFITFYETIISFSLATIIGIFIASILWSNKTISKILDPYLTVLNSLPKISLGPLIIIWIGANTSSIIFMALLISVFTTSINMYNAFMNTDQSKIILMKSLGASKLQIFSKLIFRGNIPALINSLKVNTSLCLIGLMYMVRKKWVNFNLFYNRYLLHYYQ